MKAGWITIVVFFCAVLGVQLWLFGILPPATSPIVAHKPPPDLLREIIVGSTQSNLYNIITDGKVWKWQQGSFFGEPQPTAAAAWESALERIKTAEKMLTEHDDKMKWNKIANKKP